MVRTFFVLLKIHCFYYVSALFFLVFFFLPSDYRFLEDVGRTADAAARHPTVHSPTTKKLVSFKLAAWSVGGRVDYL